VIDFSYILLDVNKYDIESLSRIGSLISAVFMLDKKQSGADLTKTLRKALESVKGLSPDEQTALISWIEDVFLKKAGDKREFVAEALENLKSERKVDDMTYAIERLFDEYEAKGMEKGMEKTTMVLKMLKKNRSIDEIQEYTELPIDKILHLKEEFEA